MDKIIDKRFERVEKALATLINSISTYNPSPALANDLVIADAELNQGLDLRELPTSYTFYIITANALLQYLPTNLTTPKSSLSAKHLRTSTPKFAKPLPFSPPSAAN